MLDASLEKTMLSLEPPYKDEHGKPIPKLLDIMPEGEHTYEPCVRSLVRTRNLVV